jgi:hypothetical protein
MGVIEMETGEYPLKGRVVITEELPISWELRKGESPAAMQRVAEVNERLLRLIIALGEQKREPAEEEGEFNVELVRIESKLDLVLDMLAQLVNERKSLPPLSSLHLSAGGVKWRTIDRTPAVDDPVWLHIHLDARAPHALRFPARILAVNGADEGSWVTAAFQPQGEAVEDLLEKLIFRHHRRQVAQTKPST